MSAALMWDLIGIDDYLANELESPIKHEYVAGNVYAMPDSCVVHNLIAVNIVAELGARLKGKPCRPWSSNIKIRIQMSNRVRFYYPDASVVCRSTPRTAQFQDEPVAAFEVPSKKTRRVDLGEKKDGYLSIPSLGVYAVIEQDSPVVVAFRRTPQGFVREVYEGLSSVLALGEIGTELPLAEIYAGAEFVQTDDDEQDDD